MQRRCNLAHLILAIVVVLGLTLLMVCVDAQAQIAFASQRDGNHEIYVMDADGGNQRNLTNDLHLDWDPSWSPDGKRIVFVSQRDGHFRSRFGITSEIYVIDADGMNEQRLTENPQNDWFPSWSPDGKRIVFSSQRDGHFETKFAITHEIYVMEADGGNLQNLTNNPDADGGPAWLNSPFSVSPAGKKFTMWGWLKQVDR